MSEHEILQRIFSMMRMDILMCRNGKNNAPRPIKNTSKQMCYNVLAEIQDLFGTNRYYLWPQKMTNADKIRSMTDEELAKWFIKIQDDVADYYDGGHVFAPELPTMENSWLDWLKREAE